MTDDKLKVSQFWEDNFSVIEQTKGSQCPTPEEVHSDFVKSTGLTHIDLDNFKVANNKYEFTLFPFKHSSLAAVRQPKACYK